MVTETTVPSTLERARQTEGISNRAIYEMVAAAVDEINRADAVLLDVGCGVGNLRQFVMGRVGRYIGVDILRYDAFPVDAEFQPANLDSGRIDLPDGSADIVAAVETIEHLENPRAFVRDLVRLVKPGGWVIVTTPNVLSWLSKLSLLLKGHFTAFGPGEYPAHITPLLELDLQRIATECGLAEVQLRYSGQGRIVLTLWHYPRRLAQLFPRGMSDNLLLYGKKADDQ
jgi:2-polyprenyl-3-methyl-5-hydroxy-6-metoxy-1,4-benzoquinol methylase